MLWTLVWSETLVQASTAVLAARALSLGPTGPAGRMGRPPAGGYNIGMSVPLYLVDAFTDRPFAGNPAAVCLPDGVRDAAWMQAAAADMNQAETAFLRPRSDGDWDLRWFTPTVEVELCGHATLASAHVLWETGRVPAATAIRVHTQSGILTCSKRSNRIEMDFPAEPATAVQSPAEEAFALGATPTFVGRNRMDMLVVLGTAEEVRRLAPDLGQVAKIKARGVIVTAKSDVPEADFVSRFFAPQSGVAEDPVTGSAHCCLGPYWRGILGKDELIGRQVSRRGGTVAVLVAGDRVVLGGSAVLVVEGQLRV